jgi:fructose-1,6-bisphosphatase
MDPFDGTSKTGVNVSVRSFFSFYRRIIPIGTPVEIGEILR